ncbi:permease-like cell division protein FtsX [Neomoorella thermoacetica]|uniref:permease-like cell division protein FtsX n=1 Tax=Neomoorella thermoacetica TaxID=1525 RepID=UPI0008FB3D8F|nr:permease-like cell division protein FtsX [Moorella thermoacetica]OIQ53356.1 cell division protein FtsX [Moorella thermoacetica]
MKLRTAGYFFRQAALSLWRNIWMSLAAAASVAISMFLLGAFLLLVFNVNHIAANLQSNVEIAAFLQVDVPRQVSLHIQDQVRALPGVTEVTPVPKEEGLKQLSQQFGSEQDLLAATGGVNPLPDYLRVRVADPQTIQSVAGAIKAIPGVEKVNYGQEVVERLFAVVRWLRWLGVGIIVMLGLGALSLIVLTIRLAVYSRRREINIMKYVGATDWFIRWPFFLEGLWLGLLGSGVAAVAVYLGYRVVLNMVGPAAVFVPLIRDQGLLLRSTLGLVAGGSLVGALGSLFSIRRFLKV